MPLAGGHIAFDGLASQHLTIEQSIDEVAYPFIAFFISTIENANTRSAYARQVRAFCTWCEQKGDADVRVVRLTGVFAPTNATAA